MPNIFVWFSLRSSWKTKNCNLGGMIKIKFFPTGDATVPLYSKQCHCVCSTLQLGWQHVEWEARTFASHFLTPHTNSTKMHAKNLITGSQLEGSDFHSNPLGHASSFQVFDSNTTSLLKNFLYSSITFSKDKKNTRWSTPIQRYVIICSLAPISPLSHGISFSESYMSFPMPSLLYFS